MSIEDRIQRWVPETIRSLHAYHVAPAAGKVKLDAMESPFELDDEARESWLQAISRVSVNRYPDPTSASLNQAIRDALDIPGTASLMLGNGSDELIQLIAMLLGGPGRTFLSPVPSFSMYEQISLATSTGFRGVPLNADYTLDMAAMLAAVEETTPACVFLAYPNNPTGNRFPRQDVDQILAASPGIVVVDEAYFAFCGDSYLADLSRHENLVVLRTLSKSGLAGLRLGMLIADAAWSEQLEKLRLPYNINVLTQASAEFLLSRYPDMRAKADTIVRNRESLFGELKALPGVTAFPSETNFILVRVEDASAVYQGMSERGVLVRRFGNEPGLENCLRITVSTEQENHQMLQALKDSLA